MNNRQHRKRDQWDDTAGEWIRTVPLRPQPKYPLPKIDRQGLKLAAMTDEEIDRRLKE